MANDTDVVPVAVSTGSLSFCIYLYIFSFFSIIMQFHKSLMYTDYLNEVNAAWRFWWHSNLACCSLFIFPTSHLYYRHSYWIWPEMKLWTVQNLTELVLLPFVASVCCQCFADFFHTWKNVHLFFSTSADSLQYLPFCGFINWEQG